MAAPWDGRLSTYLGTGPVADRPATPNIAPGLLGIWYDPATTLSLWDSLTNTWGDFAGGGGLPPGGATGEVLTKLSGTDYDVDWAPGGGGGGGGTVGSHEWWRMRAGGHAGNSSYSAWSGVEFHATVGGSNNTTGGTVITALPVQASSGPSGCFGGNGGSDFIQFTDEFALFAWVGYHYATPVPLREFTFYPMSFGLTRTPQVHIIECSDDGISWFEVIKHVTDFGSMTVGVKNVLPVPATLLF